MAELSRAVLVLFICCAAVRPAEDRPLFTADKEEIPLGESATLTWKWPVASEGYLSSIGMIQNPKGGSTEVRPRETTDYVLVLDAPGMSPTVLSRRIIVRGGKGSASDWPQDWFDGLPFSSGYTSAGQSLSKLVGRTKTVLQAFGEVREWSKDENTYVLATAFSQPADLNTADGRREKVRRIAFRIELSSLGASKSIQLHISVAIESRAIIDRRWYPENASSSTIYQDQVKAIKGKILGE